MAVKVQLGGNRHVGKHELHRESKVFFAFLGVVVLFLVVQVMTVTSGKKFVFKNPLGAQLLVATTTISSEDNFGRRQKKTNGRYAVPPVVQLTLNQQNRREDHIDCPSPLVPMYDRIIPTDNDDSYHHRNSSNNSSNDLTTMTSSSSSHHRQLIPRTIHMAWIRGYQSPRGRCISQDMVDVANAWKESFPSWSFHFHDDVAVDRLLDQDWSEFPQLNVLMNECVKYAGAMRIDIWRALLLYRYGGIYSDFDCFPGPQLNESTIQRHYSAMFLSDVWNRPSQWFQAMEPKTPVGYFAVRAILRNLENLPDVSSPRLVFVTGPAALKEGYSKAVTADPGEDIFGFGEHKCNYCKGIIQKYPREGYIDSRLEERVPYPRNATGTNASISIISIKERINKEMDTVHWQTDIRYKQGSIRSESCDTILYLHASNLTTTTT